MTINASAWAKFVIALGKLDSVATKQMEEFINRTGWQWGDGTDVLIEFAYGISTKYGEGAAALACEMYDAVAQASEASVEAAIPAQTATYSEVAKAINGTAKLGNISTMASSVGRMVKMTGVDTTMQNAIRDGAEWAWIPQGDTCAFCITLASRGWQRASKNALKNGHAEHIHANCDCTYAIRFDGNTNVAGYNPDKYKRMYYDAEGNTPNEKINAMRREFYKQNKSNGLNNVDSSKAEELNAGGLNKIYKNKYGQQITFTKEDSDNTKLIKSMLDEYNSRLLTVEGGAKNAAGDVNMSGAKMRLSTKDPIAVLHEFAHTLANSTADKYGLTDDADFWKEIRKIRRQYMKDTERDYRKIISSYEHSQTGTGAIDEFMAESFAHAKAKEKGYKLPSRYGDDFTYSRKVLAAIDKYFRKKK